VSTYRVTRELAEALKVEVPSIEDLEGVVEKLRSELVEVREAQQRSEEESWAARNQTSVALPASGCISAVAGNPPSGKDLPLTYFTFLFTIPALPSGVKRKKIDRW
jgi:hypothetical protein